MSTDDAESAETRKSEHFAAHSARLPGAGTRRDGSSRRVQLYCAVSAAICVINPAYNAYIDCCESLEVRDGVSMRSYQGCWP